MPAAAPSRSHYTHSPIRTQSARDTRTYSTQCSVWTSSKIHTTTIFADSSRVCDLFWLFIVNQNALRHCRKGSKCHSYGVWYILRDVLLLLFHSHIFLCVHLCAVSIYQTSNQTFRYVHAFCRSFVWLWYIGFKLHTIHKHFSTMYNAQYAI